MSVKKTWDFTVNNFTEGEIDWLNSIKDEVARMVVAKEVGDEGTPHLQGRVTFKRSYRLAGLKKLSGDRFHWEPTMCTQDNLYCMKIDSDVIINVNNKKQGNRTDLQFVAKRLEEGATASDMMDEALETMARYGPFVAKLMSHKRRRREYVKPTVIVHYGKTGCNKTRDAYESVNDDYYKWTPSQGSWFDGYCGQTDVIMDEFRGQLPFGQLLDLLDGYPQTRVPIKGGFVEWSPTRIFITSPKHPRDWYPNLEGESDEQLMRRLTTVKLYENRQTS